MLFWKRVTSRFKNCRSNSRQYWIQNRMTKKLQLDNSQQQSLKVIIDNMQESKNRLHDSFIIENMLGFLVDEPSQRRKNKEQLLSTIHQEMGENFDLITDFYDGLQDNQKQTFRQMISSRGGYGTCCG